MKIHRIFIVIAFLLVVAGCYMPITGRVIDAETQQPIEGAVVLVEWTKTHGFGEYWTESYKVAEVLSDKDGIVSLPGCYSPFVNTPDVTIYKKGYVAWNSRYIFPNSERRKDYEWKGNYVFKLDRFLNTESYVKHWLFISPLFPHANNKSKLQKYYEDSENSATLKERSEKNGDRGVTK